MDTNAIIAFVNGISLARHVPFNENYIPAIALGKLYAGASKSARVQENLSKWDAFAAEQSLIFPDVETCRQYGLIKQRLRKLGKPIPENDVWIAAIALQHNLILLTRDAHFDHIQDLIVQSW